MVNFHFEIIKKEKSIFLSLFFPLVLFFISFLISNLFNFSSAKVFKTLFFINSSIFVIYLILHFFLSVNDKFRFSLSFLKYRNNFSFYSLKNNFSNLKYNISSFKFKYIDFMNIKLHYVIFSLVFVFLIVNIILSNFFYSIEWAFVMFIVVGILFYLFKIDSRFFILSAIMFLGYCPFLLILKLDVLAEIVAVYVYYFLVVGIILQFIESIKDREFDIDFFDFIGNIKNKLLFFSLIVFTCLSGVVFAVDKLLFSLGSYKWILFYLAILFFVFYVISSFRESFY